MKQFFTLVVAVLISIPSIGSQPTRPAADGKHKTVRSSLYRIKASHHNKQEAHHEKTALILMQQLDRIIYQEYAPGIGEWYDYSKTEYTYNASGQNTIATESYYNPESGNYEPDGKWVYSYAGNNMVELLMSYWDSDIGQWEDVYRNNYAYNPDGTLSTVLEYMWDGESWQPVAKTENTYDAGGNLITALYYYWNEDTSEWFVSGKTENSYNANGTIAVSTDFMWDVGMNSWVGTYREEYTYNGSWQLTVLNYSTWESTGSIWINDYRDEYTYDGNQNITMITGTELIEGNWYPEYKNEFTYNNTYSYDDLVLPYDFTNESGIFNHMITLVVEYEYDGSTFIEIDRSIAEYSEVNITGIPVNTAGTARIFPQPAIGQITFGWDSNLPVLDLTVYDINGKKVMAQAIENKVPVQAGQLAPGLYFYRLTGNNQTEYTGKLIIR
ncbi:MAG: T9SS type A sorting domain-containing protein [Bacteroidota bacterium]